MNEKRFWKMETFQGFCDIFDNEKTICSVRIEYADTLLNLLNSLSEKNEQLKKQNTEYEEVQCKIMNYIIDKGLGSEFAKFLRECCDE